MLHKNLRTDIEFLRAVAAFSVVLYHFFIEVFPNGYVGVDIFFVISGYVVTKSILDRQTKGNFGLKSILEFFVRRINRLLPALLFTLVATYIIMLYVLPPHAIMESRMLLISAVLGASNILMLMRETDYFGLSSDYIPVLHTWSLGVESQFYLVLPILLLFKQNSWNMRLVFLLVTMSLLIFLISADMVRFFSPVTRFWELGAGVLIALFQSDHRKSLSMDYRFYSILILFLCILLLGDFVKIPQTYMILCSIILTVLILSFNFKFNERFEKPIQYFGQRSYSIYLWHFPLYSLSNWTIGTAYYVTLPLLILTLILADIQYRLVESGLRKACHRYLLLGGTLTFALSFIAIVKVTSENLFHTSNDYFQPAWVRLLELGVENFEATRDLRCHYQNDKYDAFDFLDKCLPVQTEPSIYILGDSHAGTLRRSWASEYPNDPVFGVHANSVPNLMNFFGLTPDLKTILQNAKPKDTIIFTFFHGKLSLNERFHSVRNVEDRALSQKIDVLERNLSEFILQAKKKRIQVILVGDNPKLSRPVRIESCVLVKMLTDIDSCKVHRDLAIKSRFPQNQLFLKLERKHTNTTYFDTFPFLCQETVCPTFEGVDQLYTDYNHLSHSGVLKYLSSLRSLISRETI